LFPDFFYELFETGVVHSDIHPGQFLMMTRDRYAMLDRKNLLVMDEEERGMIQKLILDPLAGNREAAFEQVAAYLADRTDGDREDLLHKMRARVVSSFDIHAPEDSIAEVLFGFKEDGIEVPGYVGTVTRDQILPLESAEQRVDAALASQ